MALYHCVCERGAPSRIRHWALVPIPSVLEKVAPPKDVFSPLVVATGLNDYRREYVPAFSPYQAKGLGLKPESPRARFKVQGWQVHSQIMSTRVRIG
jgi:hypothetical protein